ncbi:MAG: ribosome biogenesis GTP-binding protein YihA/YsxC, partial [Flavobacteriales bacterium]|nr:ribosome biogenesis GTP-binding protein YihA/YsxC [Flavobacteriales bacterium]
TPGKTQLINHFSVGNSWYLVDLPGYGYAKVPKKEIKVFEKMIADYVLGRENLVNMFVLIDSRHPPQKIDLEFMEWLGTSGIPFSMVFTKLDKLKKSEVEPKMKAYANKMLESWEELPVHFLSSAETAVGRKELLEYIDGLNISLKEKFRK